MGPMERTGWLLRRLMLLIAVTLATEWLPGLWAVIAFAAVMLILGLARPSLRRLALRVRDIPPVRTAVTWLITAPPEQKKEVSDRDH